MMMFSVHSVVGFILGALAILAVEAIGIVFVIRRLNRSSKSAESTSSPSPLHHPGHSPSSLYQKQGVVWILEPEKVPKISASAEQSRKRDILEVSPVRKVAKVKDRTLILTEADGSITKILLKGCQVLAVSATSLPSKKWAKRYPIKVENKTAALYHGSKVLYIYVETCWEKESWCKALRVASSDDKERLLWFSKLNEEFRSYLRSLTEGYPSLIKPSVGYHGSPQDKANRLDDPPSKVRQLWKKLSKKASSSSHDERRIADKSGALPDLVSGPSMKKVSNGSMEESSISSSVSTHSGSSNIPDPDGAEKFIVDEGTLCWSLIISRLFFDAKKNEVIKNSLKARIQRTLSNMRTPSYIGDVICTDLDPGSLPPYIQSMRAVPTDMNDLWAMEMDVEYSGGLVLYIEARLEVGELDAHNGMVEPNIESSSNGEVTTDLLENFKHFQELKLYDGACDSTEKKHAADTKFDKLRSSKTGISIAASGSRWKSLLSSVAKHVSQVPLTLAIRVAAFKGTIQLYIKPPPSDQLWFGFTSMPDINFQLESSVMDHRITYGRVASFLINRFKASIRETLVLPNCESACFPWMLAEEDDWTPRSAAPLMWLSREVPSESATSAEVSNYSDRKGGDRDQESKQLSVRQTKIDPIKPPNQEYGGGVASPSTVSSSSDSNVHADNLSVPLLQNEVAQDTGVEKEENSACHSLSRYVSLKEQRNNDFDEDGKPKKVGKKARMLDLGKRMVEKIEEKRRHIEERGRHTVDKIRGHEVG